MQRIASRVEAVTVYRAGALVRRVAHVEAGAGGFPPAMQLVDLPLSLEDGSVRVRMEPAADDRDADAADAAQTVPEASDVRVVLDVPDPEGAAAPVEPEAVRAARVEEQRLADELAQVERMLARVEALAMPARPQGERGKPPPGSPVDARLELLGFRTARARALRERRWALREELRHARERRADLEERERRASSARQAREHELRKSAVVRLRPGSARAVRVVLEYLVPGARWAPSYAIRFDRTLQRAELAVRAVVCQRTGEDWRGVRLLLSTAHAQRWTELPELRSVRLGRAQRPARTGWRPPPADTATLYADYERAFAGALEPSPPRGEPARPRPQTIPPPASPPRPRPAPGAYAGRVSEPADDDDTRPSFDEGSTEPARPGSSVPVPIFPEEQTERARPPSPPLGASMSMAEPEMARGGPARRSRPRATTRTELMAAGGPPGAPPAPPAAAEPAAELRAAPELLAYGSLRMPPPADSRRGALMRADHGEMYMAVLARLQVHVAVDVLAVIAHATERARQVVRQPLPPRHVAPRDEDGFDYAYRAEAPADIPSDGTFHTLALSQHDAPARPRYVVVPREARDVFRLVEIESPLDAPLLPGPADIYIGEDFLVTTDVRSTPPRGKLSLGLGVEQGIKVSRNTGFSEKTSGLMRGSLALRHDIRIAVANRLDRPALVEVRERTPVPAVADDSDVEIAIVDVSPGWEDYEQADAPIRGGHRWQLEVAPGAEATLAACYEVRISAKHELVGGNRREA